ncbi:MAG: enoyl-CoA hydratase/isomerase [Pseudomonadales bacterium]|nr:enoyl-CoA hydratase/isomerase [Pseudomonadales bacterium]MBO6564983.1 enoyl-CoA hydratase/isomerase [Pseudomonadales bacterium]MBO6595620.1 enoyl-CoA hydratase/isomerase [Pseudomonadales bacterium]MBO6820822.1 enoyl-CoA hydratase/isomerase [Pseudomonadales bacterium]
MNNQEVLGESMEYKNIRLEHVGLVAVVTLNAPEVLNALSADMVSELSHAITEVTTSDARCLLITGEGRAFCAGANLQTQGSSDEVPPAGGVLETHYHPVMNKLKNMDIPMVSAVNGPCVGVGMSFAVMADMVIAAKSAYFLQAFANIGLVPDGGATWLLPRLIGWGRAVELSMMAERLPAEQAFEWGLVNRLVEDDRLMDEAMAVADKLANGPMSLGLIRRAYWQTFNNSYAEQFQLEANLQNEAGASADNREGVQAFLEKREAKFSGK